MKFFTSAWLRSAKHDRDYKPVFESYSKHLETLKGILPDAALALATLPGLDDGIIVEASHDREQARLVLILRCGDLQVGYFDLVLTYDDAEISPIDERILARLSRSSDGDWRPDIAYHELNITTTGRIEHSLIFHPGRSFSIRCCKLEWEKIHRPNQVLPPLLDRFPGGPAMKYLNVHHGCYSRGSRRAVVPMRRRIRNG